MRQSTPGHWERYWDDVSRTGTGLDPYPNHQRVVAACRALRQLQGARVLEVGAGSGLAAIELAHAGAQVTVLDYVESSLSVVARHASGSGASLHLVLGDALAMPFPTGSFDVVMHQGLLEHFRNPRDLLAENFRVLRPGGQVVVDVPQRWHVYTPVKRTLIAMDRWFAGWETSYTIGELVAELSEVGFVEESRFGDWMSPSFGYRALRKTLAGVGPVLPSEPPRVESLRSARRGLRRRLRRSPLSFYTYANIGVVGRKPVVDDG